MAIANTDLLALFAAIPLAALGGEAFLKGVLGIASWLRLPKILVATTLAAFATSSPEFAVSTLAALSGSPEIGLGDALGSNVVNFGLVLGLSLLFAAQTVKFAEIRNEFFIALSVPIISMMLMLDGVLSRMNGLLLLFLFILWLAMKVNQAISHRSCQTENTISEFILPISNPVHIFLQLTVGIACLIFAGRLFVTGATGIAAELDIDAYIIGALLVAIGTSLPELVTTLFARWHGHDDVGLGTLLGSNLFNGMAIVGLTASIHPIQSPLAEVIITLSFGIITILLILPRTGVIARKRGLVLLALYAVYVVASLNI